MIEFERHDDVHVIRMVDEENRFSPDMLAALNGALATVEQAEGPNALVVTGSGKFFSNGLDLDWVGQHPNDLLGYLDRVHRLFARVLALPCPTVAACNGHTFAAGAMLAIAHDIRIMRQDRGYWCLPEVDLGMPFTAGMNALIPARIPPLVAHEAMVTGRRYTGPEAKAAGIVERSVPEDQVLSEAIAIAQTLAPKAGHGMSTIRTTLHATVMAALTGDHRQ